MAVADSIATKLIHMNTAQLDVFIRDLVEKRKEMNND